MMISKHSQVRDIRLLKKNQGGLALISVLLIFSIVAVLATAIINRQSLDIQRSANLQALQQARAYTSGIEYAVRSGLQLDFDNDPEVDHLSEEWAIPRVYPLQPGTAEIQIFDAQSRFNLNWMHKTASNQSAQIQRFRNLLAELGLDESIASRSAQFIDEESMVDNDYLVLDRPYRASYSLFKHPSELMLVDGVDSETYQKLAPYISTLPISSTLNINTASHVVLAALSKNWSAAEVESVISSRTTAGFESLDAFWDLSEVKVFQTASTANASDSENSSKEDGEESENEAAASAYQEINEDNNSKEVWDRSDFSINTEYFEVFAKVILADRIATVEMLLYRNAETGKIHTYYRDYSQTEAKVPSTVVSKGYDSIEG